MKTAVRCGTIQTVAGTGDGGFSGDGGSAVAARLNEPKGVALDREGDLLSADTFTHPIRRIE